MRWCTTSRVAARRDDVRRRARRAVRARRRDLPAQATCVAPTRPRPRRCSSGKPERSCCRRSASISIGSTGRTASGGAEDPLRRLDSIQAAASAWLVRAMAAIVRESTRGSCSPARWRRSSTRPPRRHSRARPHREDRGHGPDRSRSAARAARDATVCVVPAAADLTRTRRSCSDEDPRVHGVPARDRRTARETLAHVVEKPGGPAVRARRSRIRPRAQGAAPVRRAGCSAIGWLRTATSGPPRLQRRAPHAGRLRAAYNVVSERFRGPVPPDASDRGAAEGVCSWPIDFECHGVRGAPSRRFVDYCPQQAPSARGCAPRARRRRTGSTSSRT